MELEDLPLPVAVFALLAFVFFAAMPTASPVVASILRVVTSLLDARGFVLSVLRLLETSFSLMEFTDPGSGLASERPCSCAASPSSGLAQAGFNLSGR